MTFKDLTIVIATFKSQFTIKECLRSIDPRVRVIIIENSDSIDFKNKIEREFSNVKCELANKNLGYGTANNIGLKKVQTKYALILNPDTILSKDSLNYFFDFTKTNNDFAILGPNQNEKILYLDDNSKKNLEYYETKEIKGYAMFLNINKFRNIGFFDENFFLYLEEIDLCKRVKDLNEKILINPKILIFHYGGKSVDNKHLSEVELIRNWHWMWSIFYFNRKHSGYLIALLKILPRLFSSCFRIIFYSLVFNNKNRQIYLKRLGGIINSILGNKSWYRSTLE